MNNLVGKVIEDGRLYSELTSYLKREGEMPIVLR